ncbi:MAG TPA: hypothetical protein VFE61_31870 [Candidatus Sulfotelmatobacter sp.]|jgi:hypothetical protein|nr:hypothetical protein [Candidatus Sulfotelmatobacter sp.]
MNAARRTLQIIRFFMVGSIVMYWFLVWRLPSSATPSAIAFKVITALAVSLVAIIFVIRRTRVFPAAVALTANPQDAKALARWFQGHVLTYVLSEAIVYGVVLHFFGFPSLQIAPFFIAGLALFLYLGPVLRLDREFPPGAAP